ncbi:unnamed protein product [Clonostachys rosea f. rosea IK726]|jgi:phenylpyruvate tautomerase PptA (4-oxalocrotonate tautomerase family)|uniref:Uncharacterized protein n=1 Tax=Clonostachys rosea f. rosea IK726 TaxID=1349383 RepID=A0ACA9UA52_BIOOC|nr:unnamed protein product [Clonostachys rosea f. rosea IK726]
MPRWTLEINSGTFSKSEKQEIANEVTKIYMDLGSPKFWVNVFFHEHDPENFYIGTKSCNNVFVVINHAARPFDSEEQRLGFLDRANTILKTFLEPKGLGWEFNVHEHPAVNWRINGLIPPVAHPEVLKEWVDKNEAIPY